MIESAKALHILMNIFDVFDENCKTIGFIKCRFSISNYEPWNKIHLIGQVQCKFYETDISFAIVKEIKWVFHKTEVALILWQRL